MKAPAGVLLGALALGCNAAPAASPSPSTSMSSTSPSASTSSSTNPPTSPPSAASSSAAVPDDVYCAPAQAEFGALKCRWRTVMKGYCGGAAPPPGMTKPHRECVCDTCAADSDCKARGSGRCAEFPSASLCGDASRVCAYPGDACYPPGRCAKPGESCLQAQGKAACAPPPLPMP